MSAPARSRISKRQLYSLWFQGLAPPDMPRARLERFVPHIAADGLACALALAEARLGVTLARVARDFVGIEGWRPHGYQHLGDYACEELDRTGRWLRDLATLGNGLEALPGLERAVWGGDGARPLGRVAATSIARVATPESAPAWIALARSSTVRALRQAVGAALHAGSSLPAGSATGPVSGEATTAEPEDAPSPASPESEAATPTPPEPPADASRRVLESEVEDIDLSEVKLSLPQPVRVAFEETLDLHRAVTGHPASLASFAEALAAEALSGLVPPDVSVGPYVPDTKARDAEEQLASDYRMWASLGMPVYPGVEVARELVSGAKVASVPFDLAAGAKPFDPTATDTRPEMAAARALLRRVAALLHDVPNRDAKQLGIRLRNLVALENQIERQLGRLLAEMDRRRDWTCLNFASLGHYAEQRLGMCRRTAQRHARIEGALRKLPLVLQAYRSGAIGMQSAWLLHGLLAGSPANPNLERAWVARARDSCVERLRQDIRWVELHRHGLLEDDLGGNAAEPGPMANDGILDEPEGQDGPEGQDAPGAPDAPDAPDTEHRDRDPRVPKNAIPYPPTDQAWFGSLRRTPGMSRQRLARLGWQALDPMSDNVFLRLRMSDEIAGVFLAAIEGARQNLEQSVRATAGVPSGSPPSVAAARLSLRRGDPVPAWAGLLAMLEEYVRIWDEPKAMPRRRWDPTYERDGWRCMAPGCTARCRLEDHHIHYRAHLGSNEPWNQLCLCEFHHQQGEHGRFARCRGTAPLHVVWRLGRPDLATWWRNGRRLPPPTNLQDWGVVVTASSIQSAASAEPVSTGEAAGRRTEAELTAVADSLESLPV